jgi:hypothetical protein
MAETHCPFTQAGTGVGQGGGTGVGQVAQSESAAEFRLFSKLLDIDFGSAMPQLAAQKLSS